MCLMQHVYAKEKLDIKDTTFFLNVSPLCLSLSFLATVREAVLLFNCWAKAGKDTVVVVLELIRSSLERQMCF